jgi:hypothetical protein
VAQPAAIPLIPADPQGAFLHVLEHIIGLNTQAKWDCVTITDGCLTADDLMYVETDSLIACLDQATSIIAKTRLKTMKKWVEDAYDVDRSVDISQFIANVYRETQHAINAHTNRVHPKPRSRS